MAEEKKPKPRPKNSNSVVLHVDLDENTANGKYSNLAIANFTKEECVLDFVYLQPNIKKGKVISRIILTLNNAKRLADMLEANIKEYEKQNGTISNDDLMSGISLSYN